MARVGCGRGRGGRGPGPNVPSQMYHRKIDPSLRGNRNPCDYETQNLLGVKKHATDTGKQNESKINESLRQKVSRKTEIILEMNQKNEFNDKDIHDTVKGAFFSLTPKDKETISENLEVTNEFQTIYLPTKNNRNLYKTQNMLDLKKHVTDKQPAQQNESKINKLRQKVSRKTERISQMYQIYEDNDKDVHGQESYTKDRSIPFPLLTYPFKRVTCISYIFYE